MSFTNNNLEKEIIPKAEIVSQMSNVGVNNLSDKNNEDLLEDYMKNIINNTECHQQKKINIKKEDDISIASLEKQKLLQIIKLNELKLILTKLSFIDDQISLF